ncbi:hypothetical protein BC343_08450 [Mucilaginibacter pedocola]|uniref:Uncharacterized protein n=1 Tax=Mucilaginibacter pedocola TaxID=1792845 RepID=A0A1S9PCH2_9SPHI|nr:hypothetical protein BC343_08450 [Mucilaginibacter pedocola]
MFLIGTQEGFAVRLICGFSDTWYLVSGTFFRTSAGKLWAKAGRTYWTGGRDGHRECLLKRRAGAAKQGANFPSPWFCPVCSGKARAARGISAESTFWLLFGASKSNKPLAANERADVFS